MPGTRLILTNLKVSKMLAPCDQHFRGAVTPQGNKVDDRSGGSQMDGCIDNFET